MFNHRLQGLGIVHLYPEAPKPDELLSPFTLPACDVYQNDCMFMKGGAFLPRKKIELLPEGVQS